LPISSFHKPTKILNDDTKTLSLISKVKQISTNRKLKSGSATVDYLRPHDV